MKRHLSLACLLAGAVVAPAAYLTPSSYFSAADSPFGSVPFLYSHLENFEDGSLNVPGVSASTGFVLSPAALTDSVDGDDGSIDGDGRQGRSWYVSTNAVTFTFDKATLGMLPTHAGMTWTDVGFSDLAFSVGTVKFEAWDADGNLIAGGPSLVLGDGLVSGTTAEDRFFGVVNAGGISKIRMTMTDSQDWELDHLQYGAVPEPATMFALAGGALALLRRRAK